MFQWLIPLLVLLSVLLLAYELQSAWRAVILRRRAMAIAATKESGKAPRLRKESRLAAGFFKLLPGLGHWQQRWLSPGWSERVRRQLAFQPRWAGRAAAEWLAAKELSLVGGLLAGWVMSAGWMLSLLLGLGAFFLPDLWLRERNQARQRGILRELPGALDLLASCMEAGLGFEQALNVILDRRASGHLAMEFQELLRKIKMGRSRRDALQSMADRVEDTDFTTFVTALVQAERLGVSVADTLKRQAGQLRGKQSQRIEKQALEAPVKLLFPLIAFIFPVVFLVLFGPIIIRFLQGF